MSVEKGGHAWRFVPVVRSVRARLGLVVRAIVRWRHVDSRLRPAEVRRLFPPGAAVPGAEATGATPAVELAGEPAAKKVSAREKNLETTAIGKEKSRRLQDYFTVYGDRQDYLSEFNKININTASYRVLSALTDKMTPDIVTEIIRRRLAQPFKSVDEIKDLISDTTITDRLSVKSSVFRIIATATVDGVEAKITAVYNRNLRSLYYWCEE